jgi:hypothetical protein
MGFDFLFAPFERVDELFTSMLDGAPLVAVLGLAVVLGLRHASDPDHLVAVTSLVATSSGGVREASSIGAWWGAGHAATLLAVGLPLIALRTQLPAELESTAERLVGVVVLILAARVLVEWVRAHAQAAGPPEARHAGKPREARQAAAIGMLHGLAGTGAIVVLLITTLPAQSTALAALLVFAPMSVLSMALFTGGFAWLFTRRLVDPLFQRVLMPLLGAFGLVFGAWYAGLSL